MAWQRRLRYTIKQAPLPHNGASVIILRQNFHTAVANSKLSTLNSQLFFVPERKIPVPLFFVIFLDIPHRPHPIMTEDLLLLLLFCVSPFLPLSTVGSTYPSVCENERCDWVPTDDKAHVPPHAQRTTRAIIAGR